jgi:glycosyltransferase involved in cell wall biosynthesis
MTFPSRKINLNIFLRKPVPGDHYSIERLFDAVAAALPADRYEIRLRVCPFEGKGLFRRIALIIWASCLQGDVNHVTGDINFLSLLMRRSRTLLTITDSASMLRLVGLKRWFYRIFWLQLPIWRAGHVTAISEKTLQETLFHVNADPMKFSVIPCCTPLGILIEPRPFLQSRPRILAVGTKPNKNLSRIIEALAGIPCQLVVVGSIKESDQELIVRHGLEVENHVDISHGAMALQYRNADLVVFVSTYEGFGLPILEGQTVGRPVITSRRSPMQEVAGAGACLVDPDSVEAIREGVLRVIHDSQYRAMLIEAGFENIRAYTPEIIAGQYALVYESLYTGTHTSSEENFERLEKKSFIKTDRITAIHVLGQFQPHIKELTSRMQTPGYFSDMFCQEAASLLGLNYKNHSAIHSKSILKTIWLSLIALKKIRNNHDDLVIVWQGYGTYAVLFSALLGRKTRFILNTYKVPSDHPQSIFKQLNDKILKKAISIADGVIAISKDQADSLRAFNSKVAWIPFAADLNWWTPAFPNRLLLASQGIHFQDYILIMGDVDRDERTTLNALSDLNHPILRVTRESKTALNARHAFTESNIKQWDVLVSIPYELLRELYRGARVVVVPARSTIHPAGMTSLTEAMSCGRPVVIPSGLATEGYVQDGYDAFVLKNWERSTIRDSIEKAYQTDIGELIGRNARNTVEERINFHASAKRLASFIASLESLGNIVNATRINENG